MNLDIKNLFGENNNIKNYKEHEQYSTYFRREFKKYDF